jgi:hypothetical protein
MAAATITVNPMAPAHRRWWLTHIRNDMLSPEIS